MSPIGGVRAGVLSSGADDVSIPGTVVDNFEEGLYEEEGNSLSDFYTGDVGAFSRTTAAPTYEGDHSLKSDTSSGNYQTIWSDEGDGLNYYPQRGDTIVLSASVEATDARAPFYFFSPDGADPRDNAYCVQIREGNSDLRVEIRDGGTNTELDSDLFNVTIGAEYEITIDTDTDGNIDVSVRVVDADAEVAAVSVNNNTHSGRGIGFQSGTSGQIDGVFDNVRVVEGNSNSGSRLRDFTSAHQARPAHQWPAAYYRDGVTYATMGEVDAANDVLRVQAFSFDHGSKTWSDPVEVTTVMLDRHYVPRILVSESGWVYLFTNARQDFTVWRSTEQHSIDGFDNLGTIGGTRDYMRGAVDGNDLLLWSRNGTPMDGPLTLNMSTDDGQTWNSTAVVDDNLGNYPFGSELRNGEFHVIAGARDGGDNDGGFLYFYHVYYDLAQGTYHGTGGGQLTTPATKADLDAVDAIIDEGPDDATAPTAVGSGFAFDDSGNPHVAYVKGEAGGGPVDLVSARWDGSAGTWEQLGQVDDIALDSQWTGQNLQLEHDSGTLTLYEVATNRSGLETTVGRYESDDGGDTWSNRVSVVDDGLDDGYFDVTPVSNHGPWKWVLSEAVDPNNPEPDEGGRMFAYDSEWGPVVGSD